MGATHLWDPIYVTLKYTVLVDVIDSYANVVILKVSQKIASVLVGVLL